MDKKCLISSDSFIISDRTLAMFVGFIDGLMFFTYRAFAPRLRESNCNGVWSMIASILLLRRRKVYHKPFKAKYWKIWCHSSTGICSMPLPTWSDIVRVTCPLADEKRNVWTIYNARSDRRNKQHWVISKKKRTCLIRRPVWSGKMCSLIFLSRMLLSIDTGEEYLMCSGRFDREEDG